MKIIIVGGVAGGATAAARLRRLSETDEIIMIERDQYISYANCGLPYYIGDTIKDKNKLLVQTVEGMSKRFNLDIRVKQEVLDINRKDKKIAIKRLDNNETYEESYDKLILSCGAKPIKPNIKGAQDASNIFTLRNVPDTYQIKDFIREKNIKKAAVIGGGFIGVEMAENLTQLGIDVTLIEKMPQVLRPFDFEMAQIVHMELNQNGVTLLLNDGVTEFMDQGTKIKLESGKIVDTELTILAIGVVPENTLPKKANLKTGVRGHVIVDKAFNTFDMDGAKEDDIYAIGDMIEVINPIDNSSYAVPLAWGANRQGRILADHIHGLSIKDSKILGTSVLKVFNLTAASTGANEATLKDKKMTYQVIHAHRGNHAGYYPDASNIALKITFDPTTGKIYGAQAIGREGTEKRIDTIVTVMKLNGTIYDLSDIEFCYAPPYSSAKDPVNIIGYIAENLKENYYKMVYHYEIDEIAKKGGIIVDVRTKFEYDNGHIEGAINIPVDELRQRINELMPYKDQPLYVLCKVGLTAYVGIMMLYHNGFTNLYNLSGGYATYNFYKYTIDNKKTFIDTSSNDVQMNKDIRQIDVCGLQCPGPLMATYKAIESMATGERIEVHATDFGFAKDVESWCKTNGHTLVNSRIEKGTYIATIEKGNHVECKVNSSSQENATIVVFSGDLDKVLASMIIAQGAVAQGKNVSIFFTFWGLNALRKSNKVKVKKTLIEKMFGFMMPRGAKKLSLSNMNMMGMGKKMIEGIMKKKHVDSLETMIKKAQEAGVHMIACTMSMDLMGIKKEEIIDGVEFAGVATYISRNENVGTTLFI